MLGRVGLRGTSVTDTYLQLKSLISLFVRSSLTPCPDFESSPVLNKMNRRELIRKLKFCRSLYYVLCRTHTTSLFQISQVRYFVLVTLYEKRPYVLVMFYKIKRNPRVFFLIVVGVNFLLYTSLSLPFHE